METGQGGRNGREQHVQGQEARVQFVQRTVGSLVSLKYKIIVEYEQMGPDELK